MLGVVGYPADKILIDTDGREEKGAVMYEQFTDVQYNLEDPKNKPTMLKYRISTFGGKYHLYSSFTINLTTSYITYGGKRFLTRLTHN